MSNTLISTAGKKESMPLTRQLNFQGCKICVRYPDGVVLDLLDKKFSAYNVQFPPEEADYVLNLSVEKPDVSRYDFIRPSYYASSAVCYYENRQKIVYYHAGALAVFDPKGKEVALTSDNVNVLQTIAYNTLMFLSSRHFETQGKYRVHALGFSYKGKGVIVLLPMGGGKSTLLLQLLAHPDVKILSEDTPLISGDGLIHPFPVKIGVLPGEIPSDVMPEHTSQVVHLDGRKKDIISTAAFAEKIEQQPVKVHMILKGERFLGEGCQIVPVSYVCIWKNFFKNCVAGVGLYQGLELALNSGIMELLKYSFLGMRRLNASSRFIRHAYKGEFQMGTNPKKNAAFLLDYLDKI